MCQNMHKQDGGCCKGVKLWESAGHMLEGGKNQA